MPRPLPFLQGPSSALNRGTVVQIFRKNTVRRDLHFIQAGGSKFSPAVVARFILRTCRISARPRFPPAAESRGPTFGWRSNQGPSPRRRLPRLPGFPVQSGIPLVRASHAVRKLRGAGASHPLSQQRPPWRPVPPVSIPPSARAPCGPPSPQSVGKWPHSLSLRSPSSLFQGH